MHKSDFAPFCGYILYPDGELYAIASGKVAIMPLPGAAYRPLKAGHYDLDMRRIDAALVVDTEEVE
jgi:hypothetical protein